METSFTLFARIWIKNFDSLRMILQWKTKKLPRQLDPAGNKLSRRSVPTVEAGMFCWIPGKPAASRSLMEFEPPWWSLKVFFFQQYFWCFMEQTKVVVWLQAFFFEFSHLGKRIQSDGHIFAGNLEPLDFLRCQDQRESQGLMCKCRVDEAGWIGWRCIYIYICSWSKMRLV